MHLRASMRRSSIDALRGVALLLMVVNHTARWWMDGSMGWGRYRLIYATMALAGPLFLFLAGYGLALSYARRASEPWLVSVRHAATRASGLVAAGWVLNAVVFRDLPVVSGGVLQTIAVGIVVGAAVRPWVASRAGGVVVVALVVFGYAAFVLGAAPLAAWTVAHPEAARVVFREFPPWPWVGLMLVGLVLGAIDARQRTAVARVRYDATVAVGGVVMVLAALELAWTTSDLPLLHFQRDIILNRFWTPRPVTALAIVGAVLSATSAARWLVDVLGWRVPPLVTLGRAALLLYVVHQVVVLTIVREGFGVLFDDWARYSAASALLVLVLTGLAYAWLTARDRLRTLAAALVLAHRRRA